jgi:type II secretory pathway component PulF
MPQFRYHAKAESGASLQGVIEAADRPHALQQLKAMGYFLLSVEPHDPRKQWWQRFAGGRPARVNARDVALLTRQLGNLLAAGLLVTQSLRILARQCAKPAASQLIETLAQRVEGSKMLSAAMAEYPHVFGPQYTSIVRAGEEGGTLPAALTQLAEYLQTDAKFREQVRSALLYPAFLCVCALVVVTVLMTFVIPRFLSLFAMFGQNLPLPTRILIATSSFLAAWWPVFAVGAAVLVAGCLQVLRTEQGRLHWHRAKLRLPVLGAASLKAEMAVFSQTLAALTRSGVQIVQALQIASDTLGNCFLAARVRQVIEAVRQGSSLNEAMQKQEVFPEVLVSMTAVGEQSGQLDDLIQNAAQVLREESQRAIQRLTMLLEPTLIIVLGGIVAVIVAAILLPIFSSNALVQ